MYFTFLFFRHYFTLFPRLRWPIVAMTTTTKYCGADFRAGCSGPLPVLSRAEGQSRAVCVSVWHRTVPPRRVGTRQTPPWRGPDWLPERPDNQWPDVIQGTASDMTAYRGQPATWRHTGDNQWHDVIQGTVSDMTAYRGQPATWRHTGDSQRQDVIQGTTSDMTSYRGQPATWRHSARPGTTIGYEIIQQITNILNKS